MYALLHMPSQFPLRLNIAREVDFHRKMRSAQLSDRTAFGLQYIPGCVVSVKLHPQEVLVAITLTVYMSKLTIRNSKPVLEMV